MSDDQEITQSEARNGTIAGILCYLIWGVFPIYWKLLIEVDSFEIIAHRVIWCTAVTVLACIILKIDLLSLLKSPRAWKYLAPAAVLITVNWSIYIYAVNIGLILECSIGYYINPLVTVLFGVVFFRERLTRMKSIAIALCCAGVLFFTINYGRFPVFSIILALSFGAYGAVKKKAGYPATQALAMENIVMVVPAIIFAVVWANIIGTHGFMGDTSTAHGWVITLLLIGGGPVTAIPLLLFATAANKIPLTTLGFIQYLSPTMALLCGVFLYGEAFTLAHAVCLGCIWVGIALVSIESLRKKPAVG